MIRTPLLVMLLLPGLVPGEAQAVICKTVDADGVVSYADVAASECPHTVKLPDYSSYKPREIPRSATPAASSAQDGTASAPFTEYRSIRITQPGANDTVRNNQGRVPVSITLEPTLQKGHRIKLYLDGGAVPGEFEGTTFELTDVERGAHNLRAVVSNASGKRLGDSPSVRFTLRQTTIFDRARSEPSSPDGPADPAEPTPGQPTNPGPSQPTLPFAPPSGGGTPSTPGATNPAFKPNFSP